MKKLLCIFIGLSMVAAVFADAIIVELKTVPYCVSIENIDSFPDVSFVFEIDPVVSSIDNSEVLIKASDCLDKGYKFNSGKIYAVSNVYLKEKGITNIYYGIDKNALPTNIPISALRFHNVTDSSVIKEINESYKVIGFTDSSTIIYLSKRIVKYSNGLADSAFTFDPPVTNDLKKSVPLSIKDVNLYKSALIFPNPSQNELNVYFTDERNGVIEFEMFDLAGHKLTSVQFTKNQKMYRKTFDIGGLHPGIYNIRYSLGNYFSENRLILKK